MAHLEVVQHLLPGQQQQGFLPHLLGDLRVEEGVLTAAIGHSWGEVREGSSLGALPDRSSGHGSLSLVRVSSLCALRGHHPSLSLSLFLSVLNLQKSTYIFPDTDVGI